MSIFRSIRSVGVARAITTLVAPGLMVLGSAEVASAEPSPTPITDSGTISEDENEAVETFSTSSSTSDAALIANANEQAGVSSDTVPFQGFGNSYYTADDTRLIEGNRVEVRTTSGTYFLTLSSAASGWNYRNSDGTVTRQSSGGRAPSTTIRATQDGVQLLTVNRTPQDTLVSTYEVTPGRNQELYQAPDGIPYLIAPEPASEPVPPGQSEPELPLPGNDFDYVDEDEADEDSGVSFPDGKMPVATLGSPWSYDANGVELSTSYAVVGNRVTQTVDARGANFPVVSDPAFLPLVWVGLSTAGRALAPHAGKAFMRSAARSAANNSKYVRPDPAKGYSSFRSFKKAHGTRKNYDWHHIVEQSAGRKGGWSTKVINHPDNLVQIPKEIHRNCINSWMAKKGVNKFGISAAKNQTMRSAVHYQGFTKQYQVGIALLRHCGVNM